MRIHDPQQNKKNKKQPSNLDGQLHGGMMESTDQFGNIIAAAVGNVGDRQKENRDEQK